MTSLLDHLRKIPIDSLGLNEDEIAMALPDVALNGRQEHALPEEWPRFLRSAEGLRRRLGLFRVAVHTGDYILSVMKKGPISPQQELAALQSGTDAAASLAATGSAAGNPGALAEVNSAGLQAKEMLCRLDGSRAEGRGAYLLSGDLIVSLMPSLLVRNPSFTVGLGDTATAAIFLRELKSIRIII
jgi:ADP-dependent phosphofructokinase/glucokinase